MGRNTYRGPAHITFLNAHEDPQKNPVRGFRYYPPHRQGSKALKKAFNIFFIFGFLVTFSGCSGFLNIGNIRDADSSLQRPDGNRLRLMTFNIRVGGGSKNPGVNPFDLEDSKKNLLRIAAAIKSAEPDIVALQEVKGRAQAKFIARKLNLNYAYASHGGDNRWGLALLSKFKIVGLDIGRVHTGDDIRAGQVCRVDFNGKIITCINVHYHLADYAAQTRATMKIIEEIPGPAVLMGDFNLAEWNEALTPIKQRLLDSCDVAPDADEAIRVKKTGTYVYRKGYRIDYIFVEPQAFKVVNVGLIPKEYRDASDHIAYFADVVLTTIQIHRPGNAL